MTLRQVILTFLILQDLLLYDNTELGMGQIFVSVAVPYFIDIRIRFSNADVLPMSTGSCAKIFTLSAVQTKRARKNKNIFLKLI